MPLFNLDKDIFTQELYQRVQNIWLGDADPNGEEINTCSLQKWFMGSPDEQLVFDKKCRDEFLHALDAIGPTKFTIPTAEPFLTQVTEIAQKDSDSGGTDAANAALSIAILLDQMPRNIFRTNEGLFEVYTHYIGMSLSPSTGKLNRYESSAIC